MNFQELTELPSWLKTVATLIAGAGTAKLLAVWLENRRLEKKDYRDTLLGRIRELETTISEMQTSFTELKVKFALVEDENGELKRILEDHAQSSVQRKAGGSDAQPPQSV